MQLCTSEIYQPTLCQLGDVCTLLHHLLLSAQVQHGRSVTTPGQFKDRSDSESPLIYMGVNQADIWLKIMPVHSKPKGEAWEIKNEEEGQLPNWCLATCLPRSIPQLDY